MIDWKALNIPEREAKAFDPPMLLSVERARKAWAAAALLHAYADMLSDGPDDSDADMAQRWLKAALTLAQEARNDR